MQEFLVRKASEEDLDEIRSLFRETVVHINSREYDERQIALWAGAAENSYAWKKKIRKQEFFVACGENGKIIGFSSLITEGCLDLIYVHMDFQRQGVGTMLWKKIGETAKRLGLDLIIAEVNPTARPFFERLGFAKTGENTREYGDVVFISHVMVKKF